jgi:DNA polymerase-3 subunit epsilon
MRQIVLDTETTGLDPASGHRIIEIGCVELVNRKLTGNTYHQYIQPDREIDPGAIEVHGITNEFLADKPRFNDVVSDFVDFIKGAELVIHNAPFDVGFINHEFRLLGSKKLTVESLCGVMDTLKLARQMHPGQRNNLDALCKRYDIDNSQRSKHGALLDAEILADVYLTMTGGQVTLEFGDAQSTMGTRKRKRAKLDVAKTAQLKVVTADKQELELHMNRLNDIDSVSKGECVWLKMND